VPLLHHPVARPFGGDREAEQLAGQTDREIADVDHFLHLAEALGADLAGFDGHQRAQVVLVLSQQFAEFAHQLAAHGCRHDAPFAKGLLGLVDDGGDLVGTVRAQSRELAAGDRGAGDEFAVVGQLGDPEAGQDCRGLRGQGGMGGDGHPALLVIGFRPPSLCRTLPRQSCARRAGRFATGAGQVRPRGTKPTVRP
jgi:hypothetical protein